MAGDRADQDRLGGNLGAGKQDAPAQLRAVPDPRALAQHEWPHQAHVRADLHVGADPRRPLDVRIFAQGRFGPRRSPRGSPPPPPSRGATRRAERRRCPFATPPASRCRSSTRAPRGCGTARHSRAAPGTRPAPSPRTGARVSSRRSSARACRSRSCRDLQRLRRIGLLLEARDPSLAIVEHDAVFAGVRDALDRQRGDSAGRAMPGLEGSPGRCR